ncbi:MAG: aminotransferase class I/II-fold pyridoxal phosphate-dependent enzyme [Vicinamibacterales bacterium]
MPGPAQPAAATLSPRIVTTSSLTKAFGLAGLKCGWALADTPVCEDIRRARDLADGTGSVLAERAAAIAFAWPSGGTAASPRVRGRVLGDALADRLLRHFDTAVVPGRFFEAPAHFRVALGIPKDVLERALDAIARALAESP